MQFMSPSKGKLSFEELVADILQYVSEERQNPYKLIVGSDSHVREEGTCFVSAVIIHRVGKGARYYYRKEIHKRLTSMQQRIFYETSLSLELADQLQKALQEYGRDDMKVEIHLDIGTQGETREMIKEIIGMVVGSGFDARIKPDACGASKVADKYAR